MSADDVYTLANWFLLGSLIAGLISTFAIIVSGNIRDAALRRELAQANERTEELRKQNLELQSDVEREHLARLKIQHEIAGRQLNPDQLESLAAKARLFEGEAITFSVHANDVESAVFALQIAETLKTVGWQTTVGTVLNLSNIHLGLHVTGAADEKSQNAASMLVEEFRAGGFLVSMFPTPPNEKRTGRVWIHVGPKPPPKLETKE